MGGRSWVYSCREQCFVGVNVSDPGKNVLIQQYRLDGPVCRKQLFLERCGSDCDCLRSEHCPLARFKIIQRGESGNPPKTSGITERQPATSGLTGKLPHAMDMIVSCQPLSMVQIPQLTRHTQLDAERRPIIRDDGELFAASREAGDSSATEKLVTDRLATRIVPVESDNIWAMEADGADLGAHNQRFEGSFEVFDLREFRQQ